MVDEQVKQAIKEALEEEGFQHGWRHEHAGADEIPGIFTLGPRISPAGDPDTPLAGDVIIGQLNVGLGLYGVSVPAANVRNVFAIDNGETLPTWKAGLDGTAPADIATAGASGTSLIFSHRDHVHKHPVFATGDLHTDYALVSHAFVVVGAVPARLTAARQISAGTGITFTDNGAGGTLVINATISAFAVPAIVLGTAAATGVATTVIRSDATIAAFDATVPTTIAASDVAATGSIAFAARRDHRHGAPATFAATMADPSGLIGLSAVNGVATSATRSDGTHALDQSIAPTWTGVHLASAAYRNSTYLRVGSTTAPTNTTAGDVTCVRLHVGTDAAFVTALSSGTLGTTGLEVNAVSALFGGTITDNTGLIWWAFNPTFNGSYGGGGPIGALFRPVFSPSGNVPVTYGFLGDAIFAPPTGVTITTAQSGFSRTLYSGSVGAVTNGIAHAIGSPAQLTAGTLKPTTQYGVSIADQGMAGVTTSVGLQIVKPTGSTNNYYMIFDTADATAIATVGRLPCLIGGVLHYLLYG